MNSLYTLNVKKSSPLVGAKRTTFARLPRYRARHPSRRARSAISPASPPFAAAVPSMAPATMRRRTVWIGAVAVRDSAPPIAPARRCASGLLLRVPGAEPDVLAEEVRSRASKRRVPRERDTLASPSRGRAWLCDNDANAGEYPSARGRRTRGIVRVPRPARRTGPRPPRRWVCRVVCADVFQRTTALKPAVGGAQSDAGRRRFTIILVRRWELDAIASHTAAPPTQPNRTSLSSLSPAIAQTT